MIATFVFVCLFAAVFCPPPPPPPPPPPQPPVYGQRSNYRVVGYQDPRLKRNRPPAATPAPPITHQLFHPKPAAYQPPTANSYKPPTANSYKPAIPNNIYPNAPAAYKPPVARQPVAAYNPPTANSYTIPLANYKPPVANNIYPQAPAAYKPPVAAPKPNPPTVHKPPTAHNPRPPVAAAPYQPPVRPVARAPFQPPGPGNCNHCKFERPEQRCGADNVTYENDCYMKCAHYGRMEKRCDGQCPCYYEHPPGSNSGCYCFRDYDPVCAIVPGPARQMRTMANRCEALCERMQVMNNEECWSSRY